MYNLKQWKLKMGTENGFKCKCKNFEFSFFGICRFHILVKFKPRQKRVFQTGKKAHFSAVSEQKKAFLNYELFRALNFWAAE